jgi:hypothetical protein
MRDISIPLSSTNKPNKLRAVEIGILTAQSGPVLNEDIFGVE